MLGFCVKVYTIEAGVKPGVKLQQAADQQR